MKNIYFIFIIILISLVNIQAVQEPLIYYKFELSYNHGNITINSTEIEFSNKIIENPAGLYFVRVLDYNGKTINITSFGLHNKILYDEVDSETGEIIGGGLLELNQTSFEIFVPYYEDSKEIIIYDKDLAELSKRDISEYSKEKSPEFEEIEEEDEVKKIETYQKENFIEKVSNYWWILLIILIILLIILIYFLNKKDL